MKEKKGGIFLTKLWSIVHDDSLGDTVCWDPSGVSFHILNMPKFCEEVLSRFFKHKNISSFVRQLNQYGFRKMLTVEQPPTTNHGTDRMQYFHPLFRRGHPELIGEIKRQPTLQPNSRKRTLRIGSMRHVNQPTEDNVMTLQDMNYISEMCESWRKNHPMMQNKVYELSRKNEMLSNEVRLLREQYIKQQQNMERIVQFLMLQCQTPSIQHYAPSSQPDGAPLALPPLLPQNQHFDILSAIEQNIHTETIHYSSLSTMSSAAFQHLEHKSSMDHLDVGKCMRPDIIQSTGSVGFGLDPNGNIDACSSSAAILSSIINHEQTLQDIHSSNPYGMDCLIAKEEV